MIELLRRVAAEAHAWRPLLASYEQYDGDDLPDIEVESMIRLLVSWGCEPELAFRAALGLVADVALADNDPSP